MKLLKTLLFLIGFAASSHADDAIRSVQGIAYYSAEKQIVDGVDGR